MLQTNIGNFSVRNVFFSIGISFYKKYINPINQYFRDSSRCMVYQVYLYEQCNLLCMYRFSQMLKNSKLQVYQGDDIDVM